MQTLNFNIKTPIKHTISNFKIYITSDLGRFELMDSNRKPFESHIQRIIINIKRFGMLCNPILVNEKMQVIDGQHRLIAARRNKGFVYYIIADGYSLEHVKALNLQQKNWTPTDFLESYSSLGLLDYKIVLDFKENHEVFSISNCIHLCSQNTDKSITGYSSAKNGSKISAFKNGLFKVGDMKKAEKYAEDIKKIGIYFDSLSSSFVCTMISLFKKDCFNFKEFMNKLKLQPTELKKCATIEQYKELIEKIYNYRRKNKVNLRF